MSNRFKIKGKPIRVKKRKPQPPIVELHTSFNIFTKYGENLVVKSPKPMTLDEAQYYFKALAISAND